MTRPNITPGPWHVSSFDQIWDETGDIKVAESCELPRVYVAGSMHPNLEQETANARAIAAVPDLLSALETLLAVSQSALPQNADHEGLKNCEALAKARSALTAAGYQF